MFAEAFTWVSEPLIDGDVMGKAVGRIWEVTTGDSSCQMKLIDCNCFAIALLLEPVAC